MPSAMAAQLKVSRMQKATSAWIRPRRRPAAHVTWPEGIGREAGARDAAVEIAVGDVVPGAARAAHQEGADGAADDDPQVEEASPSGIGGMRPASRPTSRAAAAARCRWAGPRG
jgi:hypothetical protein